jgi:hypothetical protein
VVSCLRGTDTMASLRKADLIAITRGWGYRSSQWRRRRACSRVTQRMLADGAASASGAGGAAASGTVVLALPAASAPAAPAAASPGAAATATLEPFDGGRLGSDALQRYAAVRLQPLATEAVRLLRGEEARDAATAHGWTHISEALCAEIQAGVQHLAPSLARWQATLDAVHALRAQLPELSQTAWRALAGREGALPIHEMMRQMNAMMDRGVALIDRTRRATPQPPPPAVAAWLDELHRGRMMALELIARSSALLVNAKFAEVGVFLDACVLVHESCTFFFKQGAAAMEVRQRWMRALLACAADGGTSDDARQAAAAATTLYVSPFVAGAGGSGGSGATPPETTPR